MFSQKKCQFCGSKIFSTHELKGCSVPGWETEYSDELIILRK